MSPLLSARLSPEHSPHSLSTQQVYKRLSSLWNGVCYKRGMVLYLYYSEVGTELSVSCTQISSLSLSSTPRESSRACHVGPAGLGMWPRGHRLCRDALDPLRKSVAVAWLQRRQLEASRPLLGRPAWLWLGLGSFCTDILITWPMLLFRLNWALIP